MTTEDWLKLLFWVFTPAYMLVAGVLLRKAWLKGVAKGDRRFPWYWATVAVAYYFVIAIASHGRGHLWSSAAQLFIMSLMTAMAWLLALHVLRDWWKARRANPAQPE